MATERSGSWWRGGVIYQIYPRSYQDASGDGVGDLAGIIERLPYIAALGVDAIWISPFFTSPMRDFGYDVADYRDVDPLFGDLATFERLVGAAHDLGLKVMIDLVLSHSSSDHPWFVESRRDRTNARADWYVWADAGPEGAAPNNWLSVFGGSAWRWDADRGQYYLHNFLETQPDLNLHNVEVQDALLDVARFWLLRGVDGFRLDTINFYFHDPLLRDNPALAPDRVNDSIAPLANPYNLQDHLYDKNQPENLAFLRRFRALLDAHGDRAIVGEVGDAQYGMDLAAAYTSGGDKAHMCYSFELLSPEPMTPARLRAAMNAFQEKAPGGWACWALSNHDVRRHASRLGHVVAPAHRDAYLRVLLAALLSLRGTVCLYQGEELGLDEADIAFEDVQDPYGRVYWPEFKGRDGCRTPMPWSATARQAGFSTAERTWLPVPDAHRARAVDRQEADAEGSVLSAYRRLLRFRAAHRSAFAEGDIVFHPSPDDVLALERRCGDQAVFVAINLGSGPARFQPPARLSALEGHGFAGALDAAGAVTLEPFDAFFGLPAAL